MAGHADDLTPYLPSFGRVPGVVLHDLESFCALLLKWNAVQNLVSRETESDIWRRHILDSLQVLPLVRPGDRWILDLGSGGGLPAIPLAIALKGTGRRITMVEPVGKKAAFLRTAVREFGLEAEVRNVRIEQIDSRETGPADLVTSRALASLNQLCAWMAPFFGPQSHAVLHKGREHLAELRESGLAWNVDVLLTESVTGDGGVLLELTNLSGKATS
jgi:16S rRNA (guanine527-N7)-methyltransferase